MFSCSVESAIKVIFPHYFWSSAMGVEKIIKKVFTLGLEPSAWIGVDQIKQNGSLISRLFRRLFSKPKPINSAEPRIQETYQQMLARQDMSADDVKQRKRLSVILACSYLLVSLILFAYGFYLCVHSGFVLSGMLCFILFSLLFLYAIREHIVYYQLKYKRTNLSWSHWFKLTFTRFIL